MTDETAFEDVLAILTRSGQYVDLVHLMAQAERGNGDRAVHATFETVFLGDGHPFDFATSKMLARAERTVVSDMQILRLAGDDGPWSLLCLPSEHDGVFHIASAIPTTDPRWQKIGRWLDNSSRISRCFLNHGDFAAIGDRLARHGAVEVVKAAGRSHTDSSSTNRGFPATTSGSRPDHREAIAEFEDSGSYVRSLLLRVGDGLSVHLRRVAGATYYSGPFRQFYLDVLGPLAEATAVRRTLVTGRERRPAQPVVPLTVVLPTPLFRTREDTGALVDLVQEMADMSVAVFHRNPYLHFALTDENDGSNFDVMVTVADCISVYPGFRASPESLARVTYRIAEAFGASQIEEAAPAAPVRLSDLVSA